MLISGLNVLETVEGALECAEAVEAVGERHGLPVIFKLEDHRKPVALTDRRTASAHSRAPSTVSSTLRPEINTERRAFTEAYVSDDHHHPPPSADGVDSENHST